MPETPINRARHEVAKVFYHQTADVIGGCVTAAFRSIDRVELGKVIVRHVGAWVMGATNDEGKDEMGAYVADAVLRWLLGGSEHA